MLCVCACLCAPVFVMMPKPIRYSHIEQGVGHECFCMPVLV